MHQTVLTPPAGSPAQAHVMEEVILAVRRLWFGAKITRLKGAVSVQESGGEILMGIDRDGTDADDLLAAAAQRNAYIVATDFSNPPDLAVRLRCAGFVPVQGQGTYVLDEAAYDRAVASQPVREEAGRHGLLSMLWRRERPAVTVRQIGMEELPEWNAVCWRAFASRVTEAGSLVDKQTAFFGMGGAARWYLATVNGRPAGTAILFQGEGAAQILAVGTLPSLQGRGIATAVLHRIVADWRRDGTGFLFLDTEPGSNAERLYMHLGFVPAYVREIYAPLRPLS